MDYAAVRKGFPAIRSKKSGVRYGFSCYGIVKNRTISVLSVVPGNVSWQYAIYAERHPELHYFSDLIDEVSGLLEKIYMLVINMHLSQRETKFFKWPAGGEYFLRHC
ncbi:hypothetical protein EB241_10195 [Erwinia psidii]|uniref:Uncharacterized protein n=1 Tax=Erwinia psidii TaxID=69224 RepID=A0A3N6UZ99_9GAMM|nr:hypothetical protein EB241_10195 [Erwinia psidii]